MSDEFDRNTGQLAEYIVAVDVGARQDPTAIVCLRHVLETDVLQVGHIERVPLGIKYPDIIARVAAVVRSLNGGNNQLVIDSTGVGNVFSDMLTEQGLDHIAVTITGTQSVVAEHPRYSVGKVELITRVQGLLHAGKLKIHEGLPEAPILKNELASFRAELTESGRFKFGARSGAHDDIVLALAIGVWLAHGIPNSHIGLLRWYQMGAPSGKEISTFGSAPTPEKIVEMRVPTTASGSFYGKTGRVYTFTPGGVIEVVADDVRTLETMGFVKEI